MIKSDGNSNDCGLAGLRYCRSAAGGTGVSDRMPG